MITNIKYLCHIPQVMKKKTNKRTKKQRPQTSKTQKPPEFWRYEVAGSGKMGGPDPVFLLLFY